MWSLWGSPPCPSSGATMSTRSTQTKGKCQNSHSPETATSKPHDSSRITIVFISRIFHLIKINHRRTGRFGHAYLEPLPVRLHLEDDAGVWFGEGVSVGNAFAGHTQLHFGQAGAVKDPQRVGRRLVNVAHLLHSVLAKKERKRDMPISAILVKG